MSQPPIKGNGHKMPMIPGYILERELGRGTSGVVYQARQVSVDRLVALKVMHTGLGSNRRSIRRLQREARIAAHLAHPSLIAAFDMGQSGEHWWFAMELVQGPTLAERLENGGRLKERDALLIFSQLCDALQHASEKGVVHRDIKPANILLERADFPRLVDLGLARIEDDPLLTRTGSTLGTPHYISPEQARDPSLADVRSDIWSLGATLYHTVCGQPPFAGGSTAEILSSVLYGPIPDPCELRPDLSKGLGLVLRKCLSRDPDLRYFTPAELKDDLERVLDKRPPQVNPRVLEPLDPTRGRGPSAFIGLGAMGAATLLVVGFVWWFSSQPRNSGGSIATQGGLPWAPLVRFEEEFGEGQGSLAAAFAELSELRPRVPAKDQARWEQANSTLKRRLQGQLVAFWTEVNRTVGEQLKAHEFGAVAERLDQGLPQALLARTGFTPEGLPRKIDRESFRRRTQNERNRLGAAQTDAYSTALLKVAGYLRGTVLPEANRLIRSGLWESARNLLGEDTSVYFERSGADLRGLDRLSLGEQFAPLQEELDRALTNLEAAWEQMDSGTLLQGVRAIAESAEMALREGQGLSVLDRLESDFDGMLAEHGLYRSTLAEAPVHHSLDEYRKRRAELAERSDALAAERARKLLHDLDALATSFYSNRDYEGLVAFWQSHSTSHGLAALADQVAIRMEGAQELLALLQRASRGIQRLGGTRVSLSEGNIKVQGKLLLRGDPLRVGFQLLIGSTTSREYLLRPNRVMSGKILDARAVEQFAVQGADLDSDLGLQFQRALFRYHEGDAAGARELLQDEGLAGGDLILYDLGVRVSKELGEGEEVLRMRREHAKREVERLIGRGANPMPPKERAALIGRLLRGYRDVLDTVTESVLVRTRANLSRSLPPSTLRDFKDAFEPDEAQLEANGRVLLTFLFDKGDVGAWQRGSWYFTGDQGWMGRPRGTLEQLLAARSPELALVDPMQPDGGILEIRLRFRQPAGSDPVLLAISALDHHTVFVAGGQDEPARFLSDTTGLVDVGTRARSGEGRDFAGFQAGQENRIVLRITSTTGKVSAWANGQKIASSRARPPKTKSDPAHLTIRSLTPIDLREVTIVGGRR